MNPDLRVDGEIAAVLDQLPPSVNATLSEEGIPALRSMFDQLADSLPPAHDVDHVDHLVPGDPELVVRVTRPRSGTTPAPGLLWLHSGGYVVGNHRIHDLLLRRWCDAHGLVIVSVDYRLAPEHPYPAPLDDCYAALQWVAANAGDLGIDLARLGVGGSSAGGGLGAALTLLARDRGEIPLAFQLLLAPMLDDRQRTASSQWPVPVWDPASNTTGWRAYLGASYGGDVEPYAAPARATDLAGLPPACIVVGGVDGFLDECVDYAQRLIHAGTTCELHVYPGGPHGFISLAPNSALTGRALAGIDGWLSDAL